RSLHRRGLRLSQSPRYGAEGADVRRPGILALPQAPLPRSFPVVAHRGRRERSTPGRPSTGRAAVCRQPDTNGRSRRLASGGVADLTCLFLLPDPGNLASMSVTRSYQTDLRTGPVHRLLAAGCRRMRHTLEIMEVDNRQLEEVLRRAEQALDDQDATFI